MEVDGAAGDGVEMSWEGKRGFRGAARVSAATATAALVAASAAFAPAVPTADAVDIPAGGASGASGVFMEAQGSVSGTVWEERSGADAWSISRPVGSAVIEITRFCLDETPVMEQRYDADGAPVYEKGRPVKGKAVRGRAREDPNELEVYIDGHGYDVDDGSPLDSEGYKLDENGHRHDARGRWVGSDGYLRDDTGRLVDRHGRALDDEGYVLDANGSRVPAMRQKTENGEPVFERTWTRDERPVAEGGFGDYDPVPEAGAGVAYAEGQLPSAVLPRESHTRVAVTGPDGSFSFAGLERSVRLSDGSRHACAYRVRLLSGPLPGGGDAGAGAAVTWKLVLFGVGTSFGT